MAGTLLVYFARRPDELMLVYVPLSTMALALWYGESRGEIPYSRRRSQVRAAHRAQTWDRMCRV